MKRIVMAAGGLALSAGAASAGDIERSAQSVGILFEQGRYAELSFGYVSPDVSGVIPLTSAASQNMAGNYSTFSLGYKQPIGSNMDIALIVDQPIGADVDYPEGATYPLAGTTAKLRSTGLTGLLRYKFENNVSLYGGLRTQKVKGVANIAPASADYRLDAEGDWNFGYLVGVAWERPDIAARVALTYNSKITHALDYTESLFIPQLETRVPNAGTFDTVVPQSVSLEAQTGIAADTLLFGSIRWVDWSDFDINPEFYRELVDGQNLPLVFYSSDRITYTLGLGRKFNENWSGAVTVAYEPSNGDITGNLGPNDGFRSIGIGATYTHDNIKITGGIRYVELGNATTRAPINAEFRDNDAVAVGFRVGYTF